MSEPADGNQSGQATVIIPSLPQSEENAALGVPASLIDPAQQEAASLSSGLSRKQLEERAEIAEHGRSERFRNHFENLAIVTLWIAALSVIGLAIVWFWHLIMPSSYRWLNTEDISHIQSIVTAGLLVGVIGKHFKKRLG